MDMSQLFQTIHRPIMSTDLTLLKYVFPKEAEEISNYLEEDINNFYYAQNSMHPICYYKDATYVDIFDFNIETLKTFQIKEKIKHQNKMNQEWIDKKEFQTLFALIDSRIAFVTYRTLYNKIPDNRKYDIFLQIYTLGEYGFSYFTKDFITDILKHKKPNKKNLVKKLGANKEYFEIYRGVGDASTSLDKAYSWTLDLNKAIFFATRLGIGGHVYKGLVHIDNIIDYINSRNEKEILVLPENVESPVMMDFVNFEDIVGDLEDKGIMDDYHYNLDDLEPDYFLNPEGIHGMRHAKRVLLLTMMLSDYYKLPIMDYEILCRVATFHDIGRTNDYCCYTHGKDSYIKMQNLGLIDGDDEFYEYVKYVMENHCIDDNKAYEDVKNYKVEPERALNLLKIFKDADGLDRVRLNDLDIKYLRTSYAPKLVIVAHELLKGIK